jgi:hypothetical protein
LKKNRNDHLSVGKHGLVWVCLGWHRKTLSNSGLAVFGARVSNAVTSGRVQ